MRTPVIRFEYELLFGSRTEGDLDVACQRSARSGSTP